MGKADQNKAKTEATNQIAQNTTNQSEVGGKLNTVYDRATSTAGSILPGITAGYSDIAGTGGGVDPTSQDAYKRLTGGGAVSQDLLQFGGITPEGRQAIKAEASDAARSTYQTAQDRATRTAAATGGYGDTSAIQSHLARQGSEAAANAAVKGEAEATRLGQSGRLQAASISNAATATGAQGLGQAQQNVTANRLAALGGNTNIYGMNEQQVNTTIDQILKNYQQTGQLNAQDLAILTNLANQPGVFDKIVSTIGTIGGAAAGVLGAVKPGGFF